MKLSVIIPALNESENITRAVQSAQIAGADEVIVVDGDSSDATLELAHAAGAICLESAAGRAQQQNRGAQRASGDVLVFLHADNWFGPGAFQALQCNPHLVCGAFRQKIDSPFAIYRWLEWGNAVRVSWWSSPYGDQGIFVRRTVFEEIGGFPDVPIMEDLLLMRTLRQRHQVALLPGPLYVSSRRWQKYGPIRQTLRNWWLLAAFRCGVPPRRLVSWYRPHQAK
jgi:rSAM/selenodomain-associated transferase 2